MVGKSKTHHVPNPVSLGNRGEAADAQLEGEDAEEAVRGSATWRDSGRRAAAPLPVRLW